MKPNFDFVLTICLFSLIAVINTGCPGVSDPNLDINFMNDSQKDIFICAEVNSLNDGCPPDTLPPKKKVGIVLKTGEVRYNIPFAKPDCETMRFFILSLDSVNKYSWEQIREENMILKRYDIVGEAGLRACNWTIRYP